MKKTKLKIENFLGNKLDNQTMIVGGGDRTGIELVDPDSGGGSTVSTGGGSGDTPPIDIPLPSNEIIN